MKHKRLNRDQWGFQYYPYYQMRIDDDCFHGRATLIRMTDGEKNYWHTPLAGKVQVTGEGMCWMSLIPDGREHVITVKYFPIGMHGEERRNYPKPGDVRYQPSIWYVDVCEGIEEDEYGVWVYVDKYLDLVFTPEGDVLVDDMDELDDAHDKGEITDTQYEAAIRECKAIKKELCDDISKTDAWCARIRDLVEKKIAAGHPVTKCREVLEMERKNGKL
ncbi:MAG: DUF402 domain-containing protein [Lachnospiraceae bacterium]|nr:DUF402 domain-containing protein [Lachnospiraceae bacterium]